MDTSAKPTFCPAAFRRSLTLRYVHRLRSKPARAQPTRVWRRPKPRAGKRRGQSNPRRQIRQLPAFGGGGLKEMQEQVYGWSKHKDEQNPYRTGRGCCGWCWGAVDRHHNSSIITQRDWVGTLECLGFCFFASCFPEKRKNRERKRTRRSMFCFDSPSIILMLDGDSKDMSLMECIITDAFPETKTSLCETSNLYRLHYNTS